MHQTGDGVLFRCCCEDELRRAATAWVTLGPLQISSGVCDALDASVGKVTLHLLPVSSLGLLLFRLCLCCTALCPRSQCCVSPAQQHLCHQGFLFRKMRMHFSVVMWFLLKQPCSRADASSTQASTRSILDRAHYYHFCSTLDKTGL